MVSPLLRKIALLLASETTALGRLFDHNRLQELSDVTISKLIQTPITMQLSQLAEIIGKPNAEAQIRYDLLIKSIRFEFLNCCKSDSTISSIYCGYYSSIRLIFFEYYQSLHPNENSKIYEPKSGFIGFILLILNLGPNNPKILNLLRNKIFLTTQINHSNNTSGRYRILDENDLFEVSMLFSSPHILLSLTRAFGQSLSNILDTTASGHTWLGFVLLGIASPRIGYAVRKLGNKLSRDCGGFYLGRIIEYITGGPTNVTELDSSTITLNSLQKFIVETVPILDVNKLAKVIKFIHEYFECEIYTISQLRDRYKTLLSGKIDQDCRSIVLMAISKEIFKILVGTQDTVYAMMSHLLLLRIISVGWLRKSTYLVDVLLSNYVNLIPNDLQTLVNSYLVSAITVSLESKLYQPNESIYCVLVDRLIDISQGNISTAMATATALKVLAKIPEISAKLNSLNTESIADIARRESLEEEWTKLITL